MKKIVFIVIAILIGLGGKSNPIPVPPIISEIYFSDDLIQIEFYIDNFWWFNNFDELNLVSSSDTVEFIDGITFNINELFVLNSSHLQEPFNFNPDGDFIDIIDDEYGLSVGVGPISFGNYPYAMVQAPSAIQSIAYDKYYDWQWGWYDYALTIEQPHSIGSSAFTTVARGSLAGYVFDLNNNPVSGAAIYDVITNDSGYFIKSDLYCCIYWFLKIHYGGIIYFYPEDFIIEPYDTNLRILQIDTLTSGLSAPQQLHPDVTNHPNPFTEFTSFCIQVPAEINFNTAFLAIYDLTGKLIDRIEIPSGNFSIEWSGSGHEPGIYLYNIVLDNKSYSVKKMIIL